jgi:uncharacterized cupredoxin-like copper-binding protein
MNRTALAASVLTMALVSAPGALPAVAHDKPHFTAGEPGNPKRPARVVVVTMREGAGTMTYVPEKLEVRKGEQIRFRLKNEGELAHEFLLASTEENLKHAEEMKKNPEMEHDEPNGKRLEPKASAEVVWKFTKAGTFEYGCLIPGHREAGMTGIIVVK